MAIGLTLARPRPIVIAMSIPSATSRRTSRRFDSVEQEAYLHLWRTYDRLKALEDELFEPFGLSAQQYNALRLLRAASPEPLTVQGLASRLISRAPDMTRLLDRLEERGLIARRRRSSNRRIVDVSLTEAGRKLLDELAEPVRECHRRQLGHLNEPQLRALVELLSAARQPHEDADSPWRVDCGE
jgi:DNA-binding MarR family transcriptional regulator